MLQGRLDLFEVHVVEQAYGPVPFFYDHIEVRGPRVDAAALREFCNREPFLRRILRTPQEPDPVKPIVHQQADVPGTRTSVRLDLVLQRLALCRVAQHREKIVRGELLRPLGQRVAQRRAEIRVCIVVREDIEPTLSCRLPQTLDLRGPSDAAIFRVVVADLHRTTGALADVDAFSDRVDDRLSLSPDMRGVEAAVTSDD